MNIQKKILVLVFCILTIFSAKCFAISEGEEIVCKDVTTTMPQVRQSSTEEEDPLYIKLSNSPMVGTSSSGDTIGSLIATYQNETTAVGIDVSRFQGDINWKAVADSGVKFAMIRCAFRGYAAEGNIAIDPKFEANIKGALENGIYVGVYFFSTALNEAEALQEAAVTLDLIRGYDVKFPIAYDFEYFNNVPNYRTNGLSHAQLNANAKVFLDYVNSRGYKSSLYGSTNYLNNTWSPSLRSSYDVWVAHYYVDRPTYGGHYTMWQCTDKGSVPGIGTPVDVDIDYQYYRSYHHANVAECLFNATYYANRYPDLKATFGNNASALKKHYESCGRREGRSASPAFDPIYYINQYADLKQAFRTDYVAAFNHFVNNGIYEGRQGSKYFLVNYYLDQNEDVKKACYASKTGALSHFVQFGALEGRQGSKDFNVRNYANSQSSYVKKRLGTEYIKYYALAEGGQPINDPPINIANDLFDADYYANKYNDLKQAFGNNAVALKEHYEACGKREGRSASPVFDPEYYLEKYADLKRAFSSDYVAAFNHFVNNGIHEGRQASSTFNVQKYISYHGDLQAEFGSNFSRALEHYMMFGRKEGRKAN